MCINPVVCCVFNIREVSNSNKVFEDGRKYQFYGCVPCALHWGHNDHDGVSNYQPHGCLLNRLFRRRSKKTSKLRVTGLCAGNSPGPVNSPHKGPVTRKMLPFDDVIMYWSCKDSPSAIDSPQRASNTEIVSCCYHGVIKWSRYIHWRYHYAYFLRVHIVRSIIDQNHNVAGEKKIAE